MPGRSAVCLSCQLRHLSGLTLIPRRLPNRIAGQRFAYYAGLRSTSPSWPPQERRAFSGGAARLLHEDGLTDSSLPQEQPSQSHHGLQTHPPSVPPPLTDVELAQAEEELVEAVVRQARRTFGDTLPADFLTAREQIVYERLFGRPVRETKPEDVEDLLPSRSEEDGEAANVGVVDEVRLDPVLEAEVREAVEEELLKALEEDGTSRIEELAEVEQDPSSARSEEEFTELSLADEIGEQAAKDLNYLSAIAHNQREFNALVKLRSDLEVAAAERRERANVEAAYEEAEEADAVFYGEDSVESSAEDWMTDQEPSSDLPTDRQRVHPLTQAGYFRTRPQTLVLPRQTLEQPIAELLSRTHHRHIRAEAARLWGGVGFPMSPVSSPLLQKRAAAMGGGGALQGSKEPPPSLVTQHNVSDIAADAFLAVVWPGVHAAATKILVEVRKRLGTAWLRRLLQQPGGPRVLDVGGAGAALTAWNEVVKAEWEASRESGSEETEGQQTPPATRGTVVVASETLRQRASRILEDTTFLPRLPDYLHSGTTTATPETEVLDGPASAQPRKCYDVIIASHSLIGLPERGGHRRALVSQLWSVLKPNGGVLVIVEQGSARGFEAVADVRQRILLELIEPPPGARPPSARETAAEDISPEKVRHVSLFARQPGLLIAPCTNHNPICPMYPVPGHAKGRVDVCAFSQLYARPTFQRRVVLGDDASPGPRGRKDSNAAAVHFSFVAVQRGVQHEQNVRETADAASAQPVWQGEDATVRAHQGYGFPAPGDASLSPSSAPPKPNPLSLPRIIFPPIKRAGHVTLDVCTPSARIERWVVPRSFESKAADEEDEAARMSRLASGTGGKNLRKGPRGTYRDARKAGWGDLWALGAKSRSPRNLKLARKEGKALPGRRRGTAEEEDVDEVDVEGVELADGGMEGRKDRKDRAKARLKENTKKANKMDAKKAVKTPRMIMDPALARIRAEAFKELEDELEDDVDEMEDMERLLSRGGKAGSRTKL